MEIDCCSAWKPNVCRKKKLTGMSNVVPTCQPPSSKRSPDRTGLPPPSRHLAVDQQYWALIASVPVMGNMASHLKGRLLDAPKPLQRRDVRGLVSEIIVDREQAVISGPEDALAATVSSGSFSGEVAVLYRNGAPEEIRTPDPPDLPALKGFCSGIQTLRQ
jgi:hypothetical protein